MFYQIEVTTHCNFQCFYCAGRDMPQKHMDWALFGRLLAAIPPGRHEISLQGEGEPTTHPRFWDMVEAVRSRGCVPYTITNGSHVDVERFAAAFPRIGVSLDTLDPAEADRIGRYKLDRVLANLDALAARMGPHRIHIKTVDYGQALEPIATFVRARGYGDHAVQPLQVKDDYAQRYPGRLEAKPREYTHQCRFLAQPLRRYYDIEGREYPCCYIKDARLHEPIASLRAKLAAGEVPPACSGCREILTPDSQPRALPVATEAAAAPLVSFITTCKGRLAHLRQTLPRLAAQPDAEVIVVDYDCPDGAGDWVAAHFPAVRVVRVRNSPVFNVAHARNLGGRAARGRWLAFVDADILLTEDFCRQIAPQLKPGGFYPMGSAGPQGFGSQLCERTDWLAVEGYDEVIGGWGAEDRDFYLRLAILGRAERPVPAGYARALDHPDGDRTRFYTEKDRLMSQRVNALYVQIKHDLARQLGLISPPPEACRAIYAEVLRTVTTAAASGKPGCRVEVTLPDTLAVRLFHGWTLRRTWTYVLDPPPAPVQPASPGATRQAEWWAS